jgi:hypothetical protein
LKNAFNHHLSPADPQPLSSTNLTSANPQLSFLSRYHRQHDHQVLLVSLNASMLMAVAMAMADECCSDCTWTGPEATVDANGKVTSMDKSDKRKTAPINASYSHPMAF